MDPVFVGVSTVVFTSVIVSLVVLLMVAKRFLVAQGAVTITVNGEKQLSVEPGQTLLSALATQQIFVPSACGGGGTCAMCKCKVTEGGGDVLPTETGQLSLREQKDHVRLSCQVKVKEDLEIELDEEIFGVQKFHTTVKSNHNVATFIKELVLQIPEGQHLDFESGGYIQIDVPQYRCTFRDFDIEEEYREDWDRFKLWDIKAFNDEDGVFRAYSMANHPAEGQIVMLNIRIATPPRGMDVPPGVCSSYVFNLKPGDPVTVSGPYGEFKINETEREMVYIGGGAGMAPLRSQLFHLFHTEKTGRKVSYWYGARSLREMFYEDEFRDIEKDFPNFKMHIALSDALPEDNWTGFTGFIHQVLQRQLPGRPRRARGRRVLHLWSAAHAQGRAQHARRARRAHREHPLRRLRVIALLLLVACGQPVAQTPSLPAAHAISGEALGTTWNVKWMATDSPTDDVVRAAVQGALDEVDRSMSTWRDDSDLARIRAADGPVEVTAETALVVQAALDLAEASGGAFDPTVQPLVELWGFRGEPRTTWPTDAEIGATLDRVGWQKVSVAWPGPTVDSGGTALDLSAIAKGHAVDRVSHALSDLGLGSHMVEVGGEVRTAGSGPSGAWRLGVDAPADHATPGSELAAVVELSNGALATSGNYRNFYEIDGRRVGHTLDPRTGRPATTEVLSATVVAPDCRTADGWATALMVLGKDGLPLIEALPDVDAYLLLEGADAAAQTPGMDDHLSASEAPGTP